MNKILFVVRSFSKNGPQPLRFQKILEYLKKENEVHVLEIHHNKEISKFENGIWHHWMEYSPLGKQINPKSELKPNLLNSSNNARVNIKARIKKCIRKLFFPDTVIFEKKRLRRKVIELIKIHNYDSIIASGFPFTTMVLSEIVKKNFPTIQFIYDIGDPFYNNSQNGIIKDYFAKKFELKYLKNIDKLVVTNNLTRQHYLTNFGRVISSGQIVIIQQGVTIESPLIQNNKEYSTIAPGSVVDLKLVYAGQLYIKLREPFHLYNAIERWNGQTKFPKIELQMYGSISNVFKPVIKHSSRILFFDNVSNSEVIEAYLKSNIIVFLDNAFGMQTPGKVFEVAAVGKPILFISDHRNSPAYEVVKDFNHIYLCNNNSDAIIDTIRSIKLDVDNDSVQKIREEFSWRSRAEQYSRLLNN
jgi:glycosyltransferase involved in cell wall biosynthesis